ncbi:hypothetical protein SCFA_1090006 [anaerobic digester metagenome]|uniref:Uncharacterized protein n=1 Tax=anaerobic digester metagenome TaxID=1263854 RepID=A0A485LZA9_9ZZZZ
MSRRKAGHDPGSGIRYDRQVKLAQVQECTVVDLDTEAAGAIRDIWK